MLATRVVAAGKVARDIQEDGGRAETSVVDTLEKEQVDAFVDRVAKKNKRIDVGGFLDLRL